jgi:hypothetical protein
MNYYSRIVTILCLVCSPVFSFAQGQGEVYQFDTTWKVYAYNAEKTLGFSGGFNNPQFGLADLNNDGRQDLVVFEKGSIQIKTFLNYGTFGNPDYRYHPEYEKGFPEQNGLRTVTSYMKMEDLNCDNIADIVTRGLSGYSIYYGYYINSQLHFNYYKDLYYSPLYGSSEGFDLLTFPPAFWTSQNTGWSRVTSGSFPSVSPQTGSGMAMFNAHGLSSGSTALLVAKRLRISYNLGLEGKVSFWMYRDNQSLLGDSLSVYVGRNTTLTNAIYVNRVARCRTVNQPDTKASDGWYQYTFTIPPAMAGDTVYVIFKATSLAGNNIYLDNVRFISSSPYGDVNAYIDPGGDIPGIADVDNDGDMDFFSFYIGGVFINFYKNYRVEEGQPCDTLHVNLKDACWGKVAQAGSIVQALGVNCPSSQPVIPPAKTTHSGNTLCMLDIDGDGDMDYLNGGVSYSSVQLLINGKADYNYPIDTIIAQDTTWQSSGHIYNTPQFPAAFNIDVNQDGKKDILISPSGESSSENYSCIAYYKNTGTASAPAFTFQSDTFLVDQTIDMGSGSYPMLYDYDKDGRPDMFVGSDGFFQPNGTLRARLAYYKNTSTANAPSFTLQDNDFLGIDALDLQGVYPAVGDLDNDGKEDLVVGHSDGTISFYKNMAASASVQPQWQLTSAILKDNNNHNIDSSEYAAPLIYDIDKDGRKDLIIGGRKGQLAYYKNIGSTGQLSLQYQTSKLGDVHVDPWAFLSAYSVPFIGKIDNTGTEYLLVGSNSGRISRYIGFQNGNVTTPYQLIDTAYSSLNFNLGEYSGFRSAPAIADLDGDGKYEMVLGNFLGGVKIFKQVLAVNVNDVTNAGSAGIKIYPNPAKDIVYINWDRGFVSSPNVTVTISNIAGQKLITQSFKAESYVGGLPVSELSSGIYFCEVICGENRTVSKLIIVR